MNVCSIISFFPTDVLKWMKLNAPPKMSLKLMQVCKYFQHKRFPYFVIKNLHGNLDGWQYQTLSIPNYYNKIDLDLLPQKLWIIGNLMLLVKTASFLSLMPKIDICEIQNMYLIDQNIAFTHFKILTHGGKVEMINLNKTFIKYDENDENVPLEIIFDCLPNVKRFEIYFISNSFVSAKIATTNVPQKLKSFRISQIRADFNIDECIKFVMNNQQIYSVIDIGYTWSNEKLKAVTEKIIQIWLPENRPPYIAFYGQRNIELDKFGDDYRHRYFQS